MTTLKTPAEGTRASDRNMKAPTPIDARDMESEVPVAPTSVADLGLDVGFLSDLVMKTMYSRGAMSGDQLARDLNIPFWSFDDAILSFQQRKLAEVTHSEGMGRRGYTFELTGEGRKRARELMETEPYVGPAPVPIGRYRYWVGRQSVRHSHVGPDAVREGFKHLVLNPETVEHLGPAINSARSVFLYGDAGNGKTTISEAIVNIFSDAIYVPRAVYADGQVIQLFDLSVHEPVSDRSGAEPVSDIVRPAAAFDYRFVRIKRPMAMAGGELTLEQLELQFDRRTGAYQAPPHMKANGGVFVIDDFGRQRMPPRELLNRWMIPLDRGIDYLNFASGRRAAIPFDCVIMFATNLNPSDLVEEAFLRRIRYKIEIGSPDRAQYVEIFRRLCEIKGLPFREEAIDWIYREYYDRLGIEPRACHPRDLITDLFDLATYYGEPPQLNEKMLRAACSSYFMDLPGDGNGHSGQTTHSKGPASPTEGGREKHGV